MIDCFELWEKFIGSVNTQQGGAVKPHRNFIHWVNDISASLYEEKFEAWGKSRKIVDDLARPFLKSVSIQVKDIRGSNYGIMEYPNDYGHFSSARFFYNKKIKKGMPLPGLPIYSCNGQEQKEGQKPQFLDEETWEIVQSQREAEQRNKDEEEADIFTEYPIDEVDNSRWGAMLQHRTKTASLDSPKITQYEGGFKVAPAKLGIVVFDYLKKPADATFAYTVSPGNPQTGEGDEIVYDRKNAKPLEWSSLVINEFIVRLEKKYGKFVREPFVYQTAEADRQTTV